MGGLGKLPNFLAPPSSFYIRLRKKSPPSTQMVNPGSFKGSRKEFLLAQADLFADAVVHSHVLDTIADIQRCYFKQYPPSLPHDEEPTAKWLAAVDDNAPDDEILPPQRGEMDEEEYDRELAQYSEMLVAIQSRKDVRIAFLFNLFLTLINSFTANFLAPEVPTFQS